MRFSTALKIPVYTFSFAILISGYRARNISCFSGIINSDLLHSFELPLQKDLSAYLESVEDIVKFIYPRRILIEANIAIGLLLSNVNLKTGLRRSEGLPATLRKRINVLINQIDSLLRWYVKRVETVDVFIHLFSQEKIWLKRIPRFQDFLRRIRYRFLTYEELETQFVRWKEYISYLDNEIPTVPSPYLSDQCIMEIGKYQTTRNSTSRICSVSSVCRMMILNGSNFGYALTHRLLPLMIARYSFGCSVFSPKEDRNLVHELCMKIYYEANYIANNGYRGPATDLILEQIALCALEGHAHFLRRIWLQDLLTFQSSYGCYGEKINTNFKFRNTTSRPEGKPLLKGKNYIYGGICNRHVSAVAAGAFSTAIRFIVETYYGMSPVL